MTLIHSGSEPSSIPSETSATTTADSLRVVSRSEPGASAKNDARAAANDRTASQQKVRELRDQLMSVVLESLDIEKISVLPIEALAHLLQFDLSPPKDTAGDDCTALGALQAARNKILNDIWAKADGFFGGHPGNDWIVLEEEQAALKAKVDATIATIDEEIAALDCR